MKKTKKKGKKVGKQKNYDPSVIEKKWQKKWQSSKLYQSKEDNKKSKYYVLDMFPYPSGEGLHVGHPKGYIATDVISRYRRMNGYSVLHPMGFDAFGLPAENYALKTKTNPVDSVRKNVARYKKQLEILGFDYDWSREVNTTDPKYYKWTQWIFLKLLEKGLAYESFEPINWCPSCKTGLANEDVEDGKCERCGTVVEKKPMRQWVLKITDYAERLLGDLDLKRADGKFLLEWPESIKILQKNWIGKSEGALIKFSIFNDPAYAKASAGKQLPNNTKKIDVEVFTTRPDTLFGVTYIVLAPEHKLVNEFLGIVENKKEVEDYINRVENVSEIDRTDAKKEKTGVELKGVKAINPANNEEVPVWIADYVLPDYGTGAVMAVPAHDERDWEFAKKYGLSIKDVIRPSFGEKRENEEYRKLVLALVHRKSDNKYLILNWHVEPWISPVLGGVEQGESYESAAEREVLEETGYKARSVSQISFEMESHYFAPHKNVNRHRLCKHILLELDDENNYGVSEEEKKKHSFCWMTMDEALSKITHADNKIGLENIKRGNFSYLGGGNLTNSSQFNGKDSESVKKEITEHVGGKWVTKYKLRDWVFSRQRYWGEPIPVIHCENCKLINPSGNGIVPVPEKDLPVVLPKVKSYEPTGTGESPLAKIDKWVNVKCPICKGKAKRETNTMPQWAGSSWYYLRYGDPNNKKALVDPKKEKYWSPVDLYVGGAEHATRHLIYARFWHKFLYDIGAVSTIEPFTKLQHVGLIMGEDGRKMSKRFGNVVNPDEVVKNYGADSLRLYEMFMGPFDQQISWNTDSIAGVRRFIEKVWRAVEKLKVKSLSSNENDGIGNNLQVLINKTVKKVTEDIENMRFNTAISAMMIMVNEIEKAESISRDQMEIILKILAPFAPHFTEELWMSLGNKKSIHISSWPKYDANMTVLNEVKMMIQVNGKVRGSFLAIRDADDLTLENKAKEVEEVKKWLEGKKVLKVIVVPNRLVNFVIQ